MIIDNMREYGVVRKVPIHWEEYIQVFEAVREIRQPKRT
jgi:hypothetical protein